MDLRMNRTFDVNTPLLRGLMALFGVGLITLFIISVATEPALGWFDMVLLCAGCLGLYSALVGPHMTLAAGTLSAYVFGIGVLALWVIALATGLSTWATWIAFALSLCLLAGAVLKSPVVASRVGPSSGTRINPMQPQPTI